jgi:zinc transport system substrate-binding protein
MEKRSSAFLIFLSLALPLSSFAQGAAPPPKGKPVIAVSILPQAFFAQRVAGERARVLTIVGPGQSPHSYEPSPRQMYDLSSARIWFTVGVEFERALLPKTGRLYPSLRIVDTVAKVAFRRLEAHSEGEAGQAGEDHGEGGLDPHVWLGRAAAKAQAQAMRDALIELDPAGTAAYRGNYEAFATEIDSTFDRLAMDLAGLRDKPVFVYHPAFGYFLDEFGIVQVAVEIGGKEPTQKGLAELAARARREGAKTIFVQAQFPSSAAETLAAAIGGVVVPMDPLAPDWLDNLLRMGKALRGGAR